MRKTLLLAGGITVLASTVAVAQPPLESYWDHNGSLMRAVDDGFKIAVFYATVRPGLVATIPPGAIAFEGARVNGNGIVGSGFVYTKYCPGQPFPYRMAGTFNGVIDVFGAAPVVDPNSCRVIGLKPDSDNAHRVFRALPQSVEPVAVPVPTPWSPSSNNNNNNNIVVPSGPINNGNTVIINPPAQHPVPETNGRSEPSPDEQAEALKRAGREFCWKYPGHPVCERPADPHDK